MASLPEMLFKEWYPKSSGVAAEIPRALAVGLEAITPAAIVWERLNHRNPQTGTPEGSVAIMKEQMLRMLILRRPKIKARPYQRMAFV